MNKNQFKKLPWNIELANAWKNLLPPVRPSVEELKIYNKYIKNVLKNNSKARILILGSTPEFRDLILKYKSTPICLDINSVVFKALKTLVKRKGKEIFICSDWLKLKDKNKFDLIIGHEVFNMIPINKYSFLTQAIAENLKTDGLYIHTMILRASHSQKVLPLTCFKRYRRLPERIKKGVPLFTVVQGNLEVCCYHSKKYFYTPNDWRAEIEKLYKKGLISKKERNSYCNRMIANKTKVYIPERKKVEQIFKKRFKISSIYYPETPYYNPRNWPIYVLKKK